MVGNDPLNDMAAGTIGMNTFMTTEAAPLDYRSVTKGSLGGRQEEYPADFSGMLTEVLPVVRRLNGG